MRGVQQITTTIINGAFSRGGAERGNPAMTAKRVRQGVNETLNINVVGKKIQYYSVAVLGKRGGMRVSD